MNQRGFISGMQGQSTSEKVVTWFVTLMDTEETAHGMNIHKKGFWQCSKSIWIKKIL